MYSECCSGEKNMDVKRTELLGVPVDNVRMEDFENVVLSLLEKDESQQVVFLTIWELLKAKMNKNYLEAIQNAALILPVSKSIIRGAKFLNNEELVRYNPFTSVINILSILELHCKSIYLLGSHKKTLMNAEKNIRKTFPHLSIVGRYVGNYKKSVEDDMLTAIYKSSPAMVLLSEGIKEKNSWAFIHKDKLPKGITVYYSQAFPIFGEKIQRVSDKTFNKGLEIFHEILINPLKVFLIFPFIVYMFMLLGEKLFGSKD